MTNKRTDNEHKPTKLHKLHKPPKDGAGMLARPCQRPREPAQQSWWIGLSRPELQQQSLARAQHMSATDTTKKLGPILLENWKTYTGPIESDRRYQK